MGACRLTGGPPPIREGSFGYLSPAHSSHHCDAQGAQGVKGLGPELAWPPQVGSYLTVCTCGGKPSWESRYTQRRRKRRQPLTKWNVVRGTCSDQCTAVACTMQCRKDQGRATARKLQFQLAILEGQKAQTKRRTERETKREHDYSNSCMQYNTNKALGLE